MSGVPGVHYKHTVLMSESGNIPLEVTLGVEQIDVAGWVPHTGNAQNPAISVVHIENTHSYEHLKYLKFSGPLSLL